MHQNISFYLYSKYSYFLTICFQVAHWLKYSPNGYGLLLRSVSSSQKGVLLNISVRLLSYFKFTFLGSFTLDEIAYEIIMRLLIPFQHGVLWIRCVCKLPVSNKLNSQISQWMNCGLQQRKVFLQETRCSIDMKTQHMALFQWEEQLKESCKAGDISILPVIEKVSVESPGKMRSEDKWSRILIRKERV